MNDVNYYYLFLNSQVVRKEVTDMELKIYQTYTQRFLHNLKYSKVELDLNVNRNYCELR